MVDCISSGRCSSDVFAGSDAANDGFIKFQFEKFTQPVSETVLSFCCIYCRPTCSFTSSGFINFEYFQEVHQLALAK